MLAKRLEEGEYGTFGALLTVAMVIPTMPLQMVLAQQTAKALATGRERELASMIRLCWLGTFGLWLLAVGVIFSLWKTRDEPDIGAETVPKTGQLEP